MQPDQQPDHRRGHHGAHQHAAEQAEPGDGALAGSDVLVALGGDRVREQRRGHRARRHQGAQQGQRQSVDVEERGPRPEEGRRADHDQRHERHTDQGQAQPACPQLQEGVTGRGDRRGDHPERRGVLPELVVHLHAQQGRRRERRVDAAAALDGGDERDEQAHGERHGPRHLGLRVAPRVAHHAQDDGARTALREQPLKAAARGALLARAVLLDGLEGGGVG